MRFNIIFYISLVALFFTSCGEQTNSINNDSSNKDSTITKNEPAPTPPTKKDKIKSANTAMKKINAKKAEYRTEKRLYKNPEWHEDWRNYTIFYDGKEMVQLHETKGESIYLAKVTYYYQEGQLFLIHNLNFFDDRLYAESKEYFEDGKIFAVVGKSIDQQDEDTDINSMEMKKIKLKTAISDMPAYMKDLAELPKRLEISTVEK